MLHVVGARDLDDNERRDREWAASVWESWASEHGAIRARLDEPARPVIFVVRAP